MKCKELTLMPGAPADGDPNTEAELMGLTSGSGGMMIYLEAIRDGRAALGMDPAPEERNVVLHEFARAAGRNIVAVDLTTCDPPPVVDGCMPRFLPSLLDQIRSAERPFP